MFADVAPETRPDVQAAIEHVGYEARLTGRLRMMQAGRSARLQQEWRGEVGTVWLDVPICQVDQMPPRPFGEITKADWQETDAGAIDLLGSSIDRLCELADRLAQRGYAAFDEPRVGDEAAAARLDLEAVQHAILVLRAEQKGRRPRLHAPDLCQRQRKAGHEQHAGRRPERP